MASSNGAAWKRHPQALQRLLLANSLQDLADTCLHPDPEVAERTFRQVYRDLHGYAQPALHNENNDDVAHHVAQLLRSPSYRSRWRTVGWFLEAWWREGVYAADPKSTDLTTEDLVNPDATQSRHYFALNAYRALVGDALQRWSHASTITNQDHAGTVKDRLYHHLLATAHPVLQRLKPQREAITRTWSDHRPTEDPVITRARRLDTFPHLIDAWHHAGVIGHRHAPEDTTSGDHLAQLIPETVPWSNEESNDA